VTHNGVVEINGKRFVTVGALAKLLKLHKRTIQLWARKRNLPLIRVGNLMIFELDDLTNWLLHQKQKGPA
jgi:excisionase family DNA binding protein